ncbi:type II toxin-antitoxin system VapC family toxin [Shinella curvata]|uniref:Ribonuclease VapC n=1 Tax=Shinella curvata TaxID=1817964 RepID=A0ABT8XG19_9HYPH|nr:type II toxin-antitoxin system VapC family toxin [Shinella curvata]MCJ8053319.1 type II toxin-antitoxin system VapC family toxin [Shinella curvata]MDO6122650.1 type II toxin-antitoxin system VapC family toxin [Shinella curvata]
MIVLDTSALVAILTDEPERRAFNEAIEGAAERVMSAASLLETKMVLFARYGSSGVNAFDAFLLRANIRIEAVTAAQAEIAFDAFRRFGRGTGHAAHLNYGDCFSYALARENAAPLLFKGGDFGLTDVEKAL